MKSIKELYKIGNGPSSSHTMGPKKAALLLKEKYPTADLYQIILYGSLAFTGKGHLTDKIILEALKLTSELSYARIRKLINLPYDSIFNIIDYDFRNTDLTIEEIINKNDSHLINIFSVTVLEILGNDKAILKVAKQYMGEKTALLQMKVDKELGRL